MTWSLALGSPSRSLAKQTLIKDLLVSTPPMADPWPRLHISVPHTDTQSSVLGSTVVITLHFTIISCSPVVILLTDQCHVSTITHLPADFFTVPMSCRSAIAMVDKPQEQRRLLTLDIPLHLLGQLSDLPDVLDDVLHGRKVMYIMEPLLELFWCTGPAHAQSEKQYNFKEKVWKTTMQYTFNHSILLTWIYMHCLFKILRKNGWFSISTNPASRSVCSLFHMFCKLPFSGPVLISPAVSRHDTLRTGHLRNNLIAIKLTLDWI